MGIGASAGGLEAISQLLSALPRDTGMAFVIVQHLDPRRDSHLPDLLSRTTTMPIVTITDGLRVEPDHVYVIPPNTGLTIGSGVFALTPRAAVDRHTPIDQFFHSLALEAEGRAIGVVLSGTGSDGTRGLRAIKEEGGITFVQDEQSAKHPGMPQSAAGAADAVLPPAVIARELARIGGHWYLTDAVPSPAAGQAEDGADVSAVLRVVRAVTGVDFAQYKAATVRRRIARRMLLQKMDDLGAYVLHLRRTPQEAHALRDDLLIQVTGFFRDPDGFEALRRSVFPSLVKGRAPDEPIRLWVPGCATGEEAYSLVMSLLEFLGERDRTFTIQMFATDLSQAAIARARAGTFPESIEHEVSADRLRRFFIKTDGRYQISKTIRDACVFAPHDVTRDPPFSKLDLISCCNVLIYLGAAVQERLIPVFHYALKPTGFLKLGPSESVGRSTNLFAVVDRKHKIYGRNPGPSGHLRSGVTAGDRLTAPAAQDPGAGGSPTTIEKDADRVILGRFGPAGVVVNADMQIVQFRGKTGPYLEAPPGTASLDLFKMAREGLSAALRQAIARATRTGALVKATGVRVKTNGGSHDVGFEVIPIPRAAGAKGHHYLVLFFDERVRRASAPAVRAREPRPKTAAARRLVQLTRELADSRQHLQAVSDEHEAAMEELRAVTEEAQSSNEELQSTNEELETSKEELQATNEELITVNDELNSRNADLRQLSDDLGNVLASVHVPILLVGADLRLRRMTPVTERILNLAPGDVGRPLGDLRLSVDVPELATMLRSVLETLTAQEWDVQARDGRWYSARVRPYRTSDDTIDGAVISFVDVDAVKRGFEQAKEARDQARAIIATVHEPLVVLDADLRVATANAAFYGTFRVTPEETEHESLFDLGNGQWNIPQLRTLLCDILPREGIVEEFEVVHAFPAIGTRTMLVNARRVASVPGKAAMILLAIEDVTERRRVERQQAALLEREQAVRAEAEAATRAKDEFLAILSHELRTPLTAMLGWTRMLRTRPLDADAAGRALEVIERNTILQMGLIEDLLDVSRIIAGRLRLDLRPVMMAPAVKATLAAMQPAADAKGVGLHGAIDERAGPVRGDATRLQQIVGNLVSNAIKFTPRGGRVDVRLVRTPAGVEVSVSDTGRGIAAERLPEVFERFASTHLSPRAEGGMGLGLSIVRHLVKLHGGTVRAESAGPNQGALFTVTFPLTDERLAAEATPADITAVGDTDRMPSLDGVRVLVVDDEPDTGELFRLILTQSGATVTVTASGHGALKLLDQGAFDVLVSDIAMSDMDGYDLIREVRAREAGRGGGIAALAVTAYARFEDRTAALEAGYQDHARKPITPADLVGAVAALARR